MDTVDEMDPSRVRAVLRGTAGPLEVLCVTGYGIIVWRLALGWDWSAVPTVIPGVETAPQTGFDWSAFGLAIMLGVGWLALRGRAVMGMVAVCVPIILLSGWRLAAAGVMGWPAGLASLVFTLTATCLVTAALGAWLRHREVMCRNT